MIKPGFPASSFRSGHAGKAFHPVAHARAEGLAVRIFLERKTRGIDLSAQPLQDVYKRQLTRCQDPLTLP